jgi:hypothetical protein
MRFPDADFPVECAHQRGRIEADPPQCRRERRRRITEQRQRNVFNADIRMLEALRLGQSAAVKRRAFSAASREHQLFSNHWEIFSSA